MKEHYCKHRECCCKQKKKMNQNKEANNIWVIKQRLSDSNDQKSTQPKVRLYELEPEV
jgi:hypothetical protein